MSPWRDSATRAAVLFATVAGGGVMVLGLAWHGVADLVVVPLQLPGVMSGGLGGIALLGAGLGFLDIHLERRRTANDRIKLDIIIHEAEVFVERFLERHTDRRHPGPHQLNIRDRRVGALSVNDSGNGDDSL